MRILVRDPVEATRRFGGATWEPKVGWWTFTAVPVSGSVAGLRPRDAIYVPTREKGGEALESSMLFYGV